METSSSSALLLNCDDESRRGSTDSIPPSSTDEKNFKWTRSKNGESQGASSNERRRSFSREKVKVKVDRVFWGKLTRISNIISSLSCNKYSFTMSRTSFKSVFLVLIIIIVVASVSSVFDSEYEAKAQSQREMVLRVQEKLNALYEIDTSATLSVEKGEEPENSQTPEALPLLLEQEQGSGRRGNRGRGRGRKIPNRNSNLPWTYVCQEDRCVKQLNESPEANKVTQEVCWLTCGSSGAIWPKPAEVTLSKTTAGFFYENFFIRDIQGPNEYIRSLLSISSNFTRHQLMKSVDPRNLDRKNFVRSVQNPDVPKYHSPENTMVEVMLRVKDSTVLMQENTDESYELVVKSVTMGTGALITVTISGHTYFGARHGLETLSQLITYDEFNSCFQIVDDVKIKDGPAYTIRGIMIDTARNFMPVSSIYRVLDAMSYNKLNNLHWHLTDSNSFPFEASRVPEMSKYGAYSANEIYTKEDVQHLVSYAMLRGIQIIPELDAPAHAGNGWQWGKRAGLGDLAVCVGKEPWRSYCGQPPCGQLNPTNNNVYTVLGKLYEDLLEAFTPSLLHMGGDEVIPRCWQEIPGIEDWMRGLKLGNHFEVWGYFHEMTHQRLVEANKGQPMKGIIWSSGLTGSQVGRSYLQPENFIVQIWEGSSSPQIKDLLSGGYKLIFSNVDALYLDMGSGTWLGSEHTYPYLNWQKMYDNNLEHIVKKFFPRNDAKSLDKYISQVLGGIAPLWSEKVNENSLEMKLWPRAAALAERLWTNPQESRTGLVYARLNEWNQKLKSRGVHTSVLQPESCLQMTGNCDDPDHRI